MGRIYTITSNADLSVAAAEELLAFKVPANKTVRLLRAKWTPSSSEDSKQLATRIGKLTADVAAGTAVTEVLKHDPSDVADGLTNIWQAGTLGTVAADGLVDQHADDQRVGYSYHPTPEEIVTFVSGDVVGMGLLEAPAASIALRPVMIIEVSG